MIIGTAGHIDHGKTALVRTLTGVDTDRLKEEKARGISIELGFAYLPTGDGGVIGFVDVPGHERFVQTMLAGAGGIDAVLLVVAANDGIMPQTREHLAIVDLLGIARGLVALSKADLVGPERLAQVAGDIDGLLAKTRLAGCDIVPVSVLTGAGLDVLRQKISTLAAGSAARARDGRFRLAVDRCFILPGAGTIVTGTVLSGVVRVGDRVTLSPSGLAARVRSIHAQNQAAGAGSAGERCALNLVGEAISKDAIRRGDMMLDPTLHAPTARIDVLLQVLPEQTKPIGPWLPARLHHAAAKIGARVVPLGAAPIAPGSEALAQLVLDQPIAAAAGDRFVLRDTTARRTIGGGRLLDLRAPARGRRTPERLAQLAAHALDDPSEALAALLATAPHAIDLAAFTRDRALAVDQIEAWERQLGLVLFRAGDSVTALRAADWTRLRQSLLESLARLHQEQPDLPGSGVERLRLSLAPSLPRPIFTVALRGLACTGEIALDGAWVRLASHTARLTPRDEAIWADVGPLLGSAARFHPPRVRDIAATLNRPEAEIRRLLKLLGRTGRLDEVAHDHFFRRATVAEMVRIAARLAADGKTGQFAAAQFRDGIGAGRKVAIQILEFLDRHGVTVRRGDLRSVNRHRLDLFDTGEEY